MLNKPINWSRIEKTTLYISILLFLLYQAVSVAFPTVLALFPSQTPGVFLAVSLLLAIHYLIRLIEKSSTISLFNTHSTFSEALQECLEPSDQINDLCILALTSRSYLEHLRIQPRTIGKVRLLLLYFDDNVTERNPNSPQTPLLLNDILTSWKLLVASR